MAVFGDHNQAEIIGNITNELEVRYTAGGSAVTNFGVATNRSYRKQGSDEWQEEVTFHNIVVWGNDAEYLSQRASKGTRIFVKGRLQTRSWEDQDGKKNYRTEIVADQVILLDRYERGADAGASAGGQGGSSPQQAPTQGKSQKSGGGNEIDPDDLPF